MWHLTLKINDYASLVDQVKTVQKYGKVTQIIGLTIEASGPNASIGEICLIYPQHKTKPIDAEVVGFREDKILLMPLADLNEIGPGSLVVGTGQSMKIKVGSALLGKVLDGLGDPLDDDVFTKAPKTFSTAGDPPDPLKRPIISEPLEVGITAIDSVLTLGKGQRVGIFSGSGVGKSTLLGMVARNTSADINVIALIGERGREVREFIERDLGPEGLERSVLVVATSDKPALQRIKGAMTATAIAEYFRDQGKNVMLMMDSVTRFAMAQREVGLAIGEPPTSKGYTPSVFGVLPKLLERSGTSEKGTITAFYTVLVDGDDFNEPIADSVRGILDGHIVLDRELAEKGHFPAINVLSSVSRVMKDIVSKEHQKATEELKRRLSVYESSKDLIQIGAYKKGANKETDEAIASYPLISRFLQQDYNEPTDFKKSVQELLSLFGKDDRHG